MVIKSIYTVHTILYLCGNKNDKITLQNKEKCVKKMCLTMLRKMMWSNTLWNKLNVFLNYMLLN